MLKNLAGVGALLLGIFLIMLGNQMHFTLIGVRGGLEGFSAAELAVVTSGYFIGFLAGAHFSPRLIRHVGHVRVFAALGSFMSATLIAFPLLTEPVPWVFFRILIGFSMSGIYVTAESWLNNAATNDNRGKVLSAYMIAQTIGIIGAQALLTLGDAASSALFMGASILVSISFAPILLSATPVPVVKITRSMSVRALYKSSPLGTVGIFMLGIIYATQSGMGAVFGSQIGLSATQTALFIAMLFAGALAFQYPMGWLSDRMDRRKLIFIAAGMGAISCVLGWLSKDLLVPLMIGTFLAGGMTSPLYALFLAHTNDALSAEDMPGASGGLVFTFGLGAIIGPLLTGWAMQSFGPYFFWPVLGFTFLILSAYTRYRMTKPAKVTPQQTESYLGVVPGPSQVAVEAATNWSAEQVGTDHQNTNTDEADETKQDIASTGR